MAGKWEWEECLKNMLYPTSRSPTVEKAIDNPDTYKRTIIDEFIIMFVVHGGSSYLLVAIFEKGLGLVQRKTFKDSLAKGGSVGESLAIMSGVDGSVYCCLEKLHGKDDGSPQDHLQICVIFGATYYVCEAFRKHQRANALPLSRTLRQLENSPQIAFPFLPPFTLPLPFFKSNSALQPAEPHSARKSQNQK